MEVGRATSITTSTVVPIRISTPIATVSAISPRIVSLPSPCRGIRWLCRTRVRPCHRYAQAAGERLDRFLAERIGTMSCSRVKSLIEAGQVRRDGTVVCEPADGVRAGATYEVDVPAPKPAIPQPERIPGAIFYAGRGHLIVLDKPAGLVVHPAPGNESSGTLVSASIAHAGEELAIGGEQRPGRCRPVG